MLQRCARHTALERQDLSRTYLAHHELESKIILIIIMLQARIQGMFAAHAMAGVTDEMAFGFNFELFTHITRFCGQKVVLLGLYNGQGLHQEPEEDMVTYSRTTQVCLVVSACSCHTGL